MDGRLTAMEAAGGLGVSSFPGHVLGMPHDDSNLCTRLFGPLEKHHMMAPLYVQLNKTRPWSPCSASFLREFLDRGYGRSPLLPGRRRAPAFLDRGYGRSPLLPGRQQAPTLLASQDGRHSAAVSSLPSRAEVLYPLL